MSDYQELRDFLDRYGYEGESFEDITKLFLGNKNITELPPHGFTLLPKLTYLYLQYNQFTHLPGGGLRNLPNLKDLSLDNNQLTHLPEYIGEYTTLRELYIKNNPLQYIPFSFKKLNVGMTFEKMEEDWIVKEHTK